MNNTERLLAKIESYKLTGSQARETKTVYLSEIRDNEKALNSMSSRQFEELFYTIGTKMKVYQKNSRRRAAVVKNVLRLERHAYAPELNTLHFKDGSSKRTPRAYTISQAVSQFLYN